MNREQLMELGNKIISFEGSERELDEMYELFNRNVPRPNGANLFFYPENYNASRDDISQYNPTVEDVVDKCMSYKSILL